MSDATVRVTSSIAAALAVYALIALATPLDVWMRVLLAVVAAAIAWYFAAKLAGKSQGAQHRTASGITGDNIRIDHLKTSGGTGSSETASDIHGKGDVTIQNVEEDRGRP